MTTLTTAQPVLAVSHDATVVTAVERFTSSTTTPGPTAAERDPSTATTPPPVAAVVAASRRLGTEIAHEPGFVAGMLLSGQQGELVLYSQWEDAERPARVRDAWSLAPAVPGLELVDARTFAVDFSAPDPVSHASLAGTPYAHFGVFTVTPDHQEEMLARARATAPNSLGTGGLVAINFHRSLDGERVLNLGLWSTFDDFGALHGREGFHAGAKYWTGVATFRPHFFEVATVVTRATVTGSAVA
jgi:hypothetical protein